MERVLSLVLAYVLIVIPSLCAPLAEDQPQAESQQQTEQAQTNGPPAEKPAPIRAAGSTVSPPAPAPENESELFQNTLASLDPTEFQKSIEFYERSGKKPVWFFQGNLNKCGQIAIETLKNATQEGLNPDDYQEATQQGPHPKDWVNAEILLTKNFLKYIKHVRIGRIDPKKISHHIKFHSPPTEPIELLLQAVEDNSSECRLLTEMAPSVPQYDDLKDILANYRLLATEKGPQPTLGDVNGLKLGDKSPEVKTLREILVFHGDMEETGDESETFDKALETGLKQFQTRHTLEPDGVVGSKTKEALNTPIKEFIRKVVINLERLRWLPDELGDKNILVNVAGYEVRAYDGKTLKLTIPAIVGRPSRRTPLFYAPLRNVIINPSWGVPYSILVHDKIPKILNDPDYVRRSGFTVTDDLGNVVDPDEADWENEGTHYRLRQSPGRHNALGRLKFNIENPYTIYMHGTPSANLWQKIARPFSSGCIRLKDPVSLAAWVLDDPKKWSAAEIQKDINQGGTKTIKPEAQIGVFFTYQTIWFGNDGLVHVSDDPYRMDPKMIRILYPNP